MHATKEIAPTFQVRHEIDAEGLHTGTAMMDVWDTDSVQLAWRKVRLQSVKLQWMKLVVWDSKEHEYDANFLYFDIDPYSVFGGYICLPVLLYKSKTRVGGFTFVLLGMLIGALSGFLAFFNLDQTKGWNPYGWWFIASFFAAIFGGILGMLIYGVITNKRPKT